MTITRAPRILFAVAALAAAVAPMLLASAAAARPGEGEGEGVEEASLPRSFTGDASPGEQKILIKNTRCGTRQCGGPAPMKVSGSVTVCGQAADAHVYSVGQSGSQSALCTVTREEGKGCSTVTCKGDLQAGKTLQVACGDGTGAADGESAGCRYQIKVE